MAEWRVDNNGTGETVSIYHGDRLVADVYDEQEALDIVRAELQLGELYEALNLALGRELTLQRQIAALAAGQPVPPVDGAAGADTGRPLSQAERE